MEELRGTDILEREILEDARKKADRVLKNAESEIAALGKELKDRHEKAMLELEARYSKKTEDARKEIDSSLPLELKRRRIEYYDGILREHLERYFSSFDSARIRSVVRQFLEHTKGLFSGKELNIRFGGMSREEALKLVGETCGGCIPERIEPDESIRGLAIELTDGTMRLTATLGLLEQILLDERREELFSSLFEGKEEDGRR